MPKVIPKELYNFQEVAIFLKHAQPSVTSYGSRAVKNGSEERTLNECIKVIEAIATAKNILQGRNCYVIQYRIFKCSQRIQKLSQEAETLIKVEKILQRATNMSGTVESIGKHLKNNRPVNKKIDYEYTRNIFEGEANFCHFAPYFQEFKKTFEELVPEDKRSKKRFFACLWMELLRMEEILSKDETQQQWLNYLNAVLPTLSTTPQVLIWLLQKVKKEWSDGASIAKNPWIEPLEEKLKKFNVTQDILC